MNRLKFSEGGQPVYLDDIRLIQENDINSVRSIISALSDNVEAFLLKELSAELVSATETGSTFIIHGGVLVVDGDFLKWEDTTVNVATWDDPLYICIKETETDRRVFEDAQERCCVITKEVYLSTNHDGVSTYYNMFELPVFSNLIKKLIGYNTTAWQNVDVTFYNGFSGQVKKKVVEGETYISINIRSSRDSWATNIEGGSPGGLFKVNNDEDWNMLYGQAFTIVFHKTSFGGYIDVLCLANDMGVAFLKGVGDVKVDTIHSPNGIISCELKLSNYLQGLNS